MSGIIDKIECNYLSFKLSMDCLRVKVESGEYVQKEAKPAKWLMVDELDLIQGF